MLPSNHFVANWSCTTSGAVGGLFPFLKGLIYCTGISRHCSEGFRSDDIKYHNEKLYHQCDTEHDMRTLAPIPRKNDYACQQAANCLWLALVNFLDIDTWGNTGRNMRKRNAGREDKKQSRRLVSYTYWFDMVAKNIKKVQTRSMGDITR